MGGRTSTYKSLTARTHANNLNSWEYMNSECISKCAALVKSGGKKKASLLNLELFSIFLNAAFCECCSEQDVWYINCSVPAVTCD